MARGRGIPQQPTGGAPRARGRGRGRSRVERAAADTRPTLTDPSPSQPQQIFPAPSPTQPLQLPPYVHGSPYHVRGSTSPAATSSLSPAQQHSTSSPFSAAAPSHPATTGQMRTSSSHIPAPSHSHDAEPMHEEEDADDYDVDDHGADELGADELGTDELYINDLQQQAHQGQEGDNRPWLTFVKTDNGVE